MIDKTDDVLEGLNDFLKTITDRITPNIILIVALINGFLIGLATTGYMGDKSLSVWSLSFFLIIWQLFIICIFSSRYIDLTTSYLNKFFLSGWIGFMWQWQFFGMWVIEFRPEIKTIFPPISNMAVGMMMGYFSLMFLFGYCFKGNKRNANSSNIYKLKDKDKDAA